LEAAVLNTLLREFSILGYPRSLEEEIRKYIDFKNREYYFSFAKTEDEIRYIRKRIDLATTECKVDISKQYLKDYIEEMELDIVNLQNKADLLKQQIIEPNWESTL
jgi:hypothetical protein